MPDDSDTQVDPDNTAVNERDAEGTTKTPFDQSNEQSQIDLVAKIRSEVMEIDDLSTNGGNVKIITEGGNVTLRGPVNSEAERDAIVKVAAAATGDSSRVTNELQVAPN